MTFVVSVLASIQRVSGGKDLTGGARRVARGLSSQGSSRATLTKALPVGGLPAGRALLKILLSWRGKSD